MQQRYRFLRWCSPDVELEELPREYERYRREKIGDGGSEG
jgi:hypothetical protein